MSHSTATAERSFSVLKRVKTYLLSTMRQEDYQPWHYYCHIHRHIQLPLGAVVKTDKLFWVVTCGNFIHMVKGY